MSWSFRIFQPGSYRFWVDYSFQHWGHQDFQFGDYHVSPPITHKAVFKQTVEWGQVGPHLVLPAGVHTITRQEFVNGGSSAWLFGVSLAHSSTQVESIRGK
jgi:hypothetical protein